jgi:tRNA A37 threonylcarbamoyltransferase TsaD
MQRLAIGGGAHSCTPRCPQSSVSRARSSELAATPPPSLCTDNAAMIGAAARFTEPMEYPDYLTLDAAARL